MTRTPADVGARAHVFVDDLDAPELADADRHHVARVLRVRAGDLITVSDGEGRWRACRFGEVLEATGEIVAVPRPTPELTVGLALLKGERPELAVQKLTELGIDRVVLFAASRSVVRWDDDKAARARTRLAAVAREAAMQSRRTTLPEVVVGVELAWAAALPGACLAERGGGPPSLANPTILVGPEGGWDDAERAGGLPEVGLGDLVLRAETAALTAGTVLATLRAQIVRSFLF